MDRNEGGREVAGLAARRSLGAGGAEERELDAREVVVAEELDFSGGIEPVGDVAVGRCGGEQSLGGLDEDRRGDGTGGDGEEVRGRAEVVAEAQSSVDALDA